MTTWLRELKAAGRRFAADENGVSALEYGILVAGLSIAIAAAVMSVGEGVFSFYTELNEKTAGAN
jgi:pilus assembly protein Flp/PilA